MSKIIIGVMGPGEGASDADLTCAFELGQLIAEAGWILLTGGRGVGVMDAANRGAKRAKGLTIGILPSNSYSGMSDAVDIPILTDLGNARNNINVLSSQVVLACGMGAGTASELALAIKAHRPVILLQCDRATQEFFQKLSDQVWIAEEPKVAINLIKQILGDRA